MNIPASGRFLLAKVVLFIETWSSRSAFFYVFFTLAGRRPSGQTGLYCVFAVVLRLPDETCRVGRWRRPVGGNADINIFNFQQHEKGRNPALLISENRDSFSYKACRKNYKPPGKNFPEGTSLGKQAV